MNISEIKKTVKTVKKSINVELMDVNNITNLIMNYVVCTRKFFYFSCNVRTIEDIYSIILAADEKEAFEILKLKLDTLVDYDFGREIKQPYHHLTINDFKVQPFYNYEYNIPSTEPRIEHLVIYQGYYADPTDLVYTFYEYKYKCKPQRKWVKIYKDRRDYYKSHTYYPDDRKYVEYCEANIENAICHIEYMF